MRRKRRNHSASFKAKVAVAAVRRFGRRKVYAEAVEAGSQAAPSSGHAAALLQTGAFPRSRAPPSLRLRLRSPVPDASPQA